MKKFFRRQWPLLTALTIIFAVVSYLFWTRSDISQKILYESFDYREGDILKNVHYTQNNPDDKMKWVLDASEGHLSKDKKSISFRKFKLKLEPADKPKMDLEGNEGNYNMSSGEIILNGDVHGITDNGYKIATDQLRYLHKSGQLESEEPVKIIGPYFSLKGQGLNIDLKSETITIKSNVTVNYSD